MMFYGMIMMTLLGHVIPIRKAITDLVHHPAASSLGAVPFQVPKLTARVAALAFCPAIDSQTLGAVSLKMSHRPAQVAALGTPAPHVLAARLGATGKGRTNQHHDVTSTIGMGAGITLAFFAQYGKMMERF